MSFVDRLTETRLVWLAGPMYSAINLCRLRGGLDLRTELPRGRCSQEGETMGTVFRPTYTKPLPPTAELFTAKGEQLARVKPERGRTQTFPVKPGRDGQPKIVVTSSTYVAKYRDGGGVIRKVSTGCREEAAARSILKDLERRAELVKAGVVTQSESRTADQQTRPLCDHFVEFRESMVGKERDATHCKTTLRYLERLTEACSWNYLRDITRDSLEKWQANAVKVGTSARTRNAFVTALTSFLNWCVQSDRLTANPINGVKRANEKADRRRQRRALAENELLKLLDTARRRPLDEAMTIRRGRRKGERAANVKPEVVARLTELGRERSLTYKTLVLTGLRKSELASICIGQAELEGPMPYFVLAAADEKAGRGADIPIRQDLAADLREWIADKRANFCGPDEIFRQKPLFVIPSSINRTFDLDIAAAGIPKRDERGRVVDLHALRTTFGTMLSKGGVTPRTAQAAMRHSDIRLTMGVYTDPKLLDIHGAMDALPELPLTGTTEDERQVIRLTGTSDGGALVPLLVPACAQSGSSGASSVSLGNLTGELETVEPMVETSLKPTKKGSLAGVAREPSRIAPLGFEPRLIESESIDATPKRRRKSSAALKVTASRSEAVAGACTTACTNSTETTSEIGPATGSNPDFAAVVAAIMQLPLSDAEKAEAVRRLLSAASQTQ